MCYSCGEWKPREGKREQGNSRSVQRRSISQAGLSHDQWYYWVKTTLIDQNNGSQLLMTTVMVMYSQETDILCDYSVWDPSILNVSSISHVCDYSCIMEAWSDMCSVCVWWQWNIYVMPGKIPNSNLFRPLGMEVWYVICLYWWWALRRDTLTCK